MKLLNLIIYNQNTEYDIMKSLLQKYLSKNNIIYYFIIFDNNISDNHVIINDTIYLKGSESYLGIGGLLDKTIKSLEILNNLHYDFLIRTNISTIINFKLLLQKLSDINSVSYASCLNFNLQWLDPPCGIFNNKYFGTIYSSGTCIILSKNLTQFIISHKNELDYSVVDDVAIGILLNKYNFFPLCFDNLSLNSTQFNSDTIAYRNKRHNRFIDIYYMSSIINDLIKFSQFI